MTAATPTTTRKAGTTARKSAPAKAAPKAPAAAPGTVLADLVYELDGTTKTTNVYLGGDEVLRTTKQYLDQSAGAPRKIRVHVSVVE